MNTEQDYLLIVEDDPDILKLLDATLRFRGYRVLTARNGKEALEVMQGECPAIVIADIMMPKLDGFGFVHRLRIAPETREIPVVFISSTYVTREDQEFALNIGATRFIQKPVDLEKLLATIAELLKQRVPVTVEPIDELNFYDEYRKRLQTKLDEKNKQILREEHLLGIHADKENQSLMTALHQAITERDQIQVLLDQVDTQLEKHVKPK